MSVGDVLVIGAGPAGVNAAYALKKAGIDYRVIDRAPIVASTWASLYPSLTLNTSRFFSHMPEHRFPLNFGMFASAKQYHSHVVDFVNEQHINIDFGIDVYRVAPEKGLWKVETSAGIETYKTVISATGVFNNPQMPIIKGMDVFEGEIMHSQGFRHPDQVKNKRLLVVGNGPSGIDIAVASGDVAQGASYLSIRTGVDLRPQYPYGMHPHGWMLVGKLLPPHRCDWLMKEVSKLKYNVEDFGLIPAPPNDGTSTGYRGPELLNAIRDGRLIAVKHPLCFDKGGTQLADGRYLEVDMVIMATGYYPVLHQYLDIEMQYADKVLNPVTPCDWELGPNGIRGFPLRDVSEHPNGRQILGHPGLYLVGVYYKGKGAFYNMRVEAQIAAEQIRAYLAHRVFVL